tara:strand:- start:3795 stop:6227 length:2433 start_codon:yes stop_codon:yes gene_type:complete
MTLRSESTITILDLLCEGPIEGLAIPTKNNKTTESILFNDNPVKIVGTVNDIENQDDSSIFFDLKLGTAKQKDLKGAFKTAKNTEIITIDKEIGSNYIEDINEVKNTVKKRNYGGGTFIQKISDAEIPKDDDTPNSIEIIFTVPRLFSQAVEGIANGQLFSATVTYQIDVKTQGKAFKKLSRKSITGISTTNFQVTSGRLELTHKGKALKPPYTIKITKIVKKEKDYEIKFTDFEKLPQKTPLSNKRGNTLICSLIKVITPNQTNVKFKNMAYIGVKFSSEHFSSLPSRNYLIKGKKVRIFSNVTKVRDNGSLKFDGSFDGTFKTDDDGNEMLFWTTCPVCIFIDMLTNTTYGAGNFIDDNNINLVDLYPLALYANELVDTPDGTEPRFAINTVIGGQVSAYKLLQNLASTFRGMTYWASNVVNVTADHGNLDKSEVDPVHIYNNSNVINGDFNYSGTSIKTRSSRVIVNYNDPTNNYKIDSVIVEDKDLISKFGVNEKEIVAFGCTSKYQAQRLGQWTIKSEELDAQVITFSTGLDGLAVLPGQVFAVSDLMKTGLRLSGRVGSGSTSEHIKVDQDYTALSADSATDTITLTLPDGTLRKESINAFSSNNRVNLVGSISTLPLQDSVYVIERNTVQAQKFRCIDVKSNNDGTYAITGVEFNDSIYEAADDTTSTTNLIDDDKDISFLDEAPAPVTDLVVTFAKVKINNNTVNRAIFQFNRGINGPSVKFDVRVFLDDIEIGESLGTNQTSIEVGNLKKNAEIRCEVQSIGIFGQKSQKVILTDTVPSFKNDLTIGAISTTSTVQVPDPI